MTSDSLILSRSNLLVFSTCHRRFQLRVLDRLPWPDLDLDLKQQTAVYQGQLFHQILERHFLGLPVVPSDIPNKQLRAWWESFERQGPPLPPGRRLPEIRLTVPVGSHYLVGRFDLLIIESDETSSRAHIFDWKTSKPRSLTDLQSDWQTRLYLAMIAESGDALVRDGPPLAADQITFTYWYADDPGSPRRIRYSAAEHEQNWRQILALVDEIDLCQEAGEWPLTEDWTRCRTCPYQAYCGRWEAGQYEVTIHEERPVYDFSLLEPETP